MCKRTLLPPGCQNEVPQIRGVFRNYDPIHTKKWLWMITWPWADFFKSFFKSCGDEQKAKFLSKVAVDGRSQNLVVHRSNAYPIKCIKVTVCRVDFCLMYYEAFDGLYFSGNFRKCKVLEATLFLITSTGTSEQSQVCRGRGKFLSNFWQKFPKSCEDRSEK